MFLVMLVAVPLYSAVVSRFSGGVSFPGPTGFSPEPDPGIPGTAVPTSGARPWIDRVFYVWTSVFAFLW